MHEYNTCKKARATKTYINTRFFKFSSETWEIMREMNVANTCTIGKIRRFKICRCKGIVSQTNSLPSYIFDFMFNITDLENIDYASMLRYLHYSYCFSHRANV